MSGHIVAQKNYILVFGALMLMLVATVGVAYIHLGRWNVVLAMTIAIIKASIIILYFMHVRYSPRLVWIYVGAGFFWLVIMFALTFSDYLTRSWLPAPTGWIG